MQKQSDLERMLHAADALAAAVMKRNATEPGFAMALARGIIRRLSDADAAMLIGQPTSKLKPQLPLDPAALIG